jgi:hypothetical protein
MSRPCATATTNDVHAQATHEIGNGLSERVGAKRKLRAALNEHW